MLTPQRPKHAKSIYRPQAPYRRPRLSPRERDILRWTARGKSYWEIGQILKISPKTVNYHFEKIKRKFAMRTRIEIVLMADRFGLLDSEET
jgi:LuxR family transcriptional regulator, quorum-sensing system regulator LasR